MTLIITITDANNNPVLGTGGNQYYLRNRLTKSCDAVGNCTNYGPYDADDNLTQVVSGTLIKTQYTYDGLNRLEKINYDVGGSSPSNIQLTYDLADRLTEANDSANGTITRQYGASSTSLASGLDFVTQEQVSATGGIPQETVNYVPEANGLRQSMQLQIGSSSQPLVSYGYDNADKLTSVSQNGLTTTKKYTPDPAGRLSSMTLPNGLVVSYGYDKDSNVTSLTYGALGTLTYSYDANGRRTGVGGSLAATNIPTATSFSYNPDNSLKTWSSNSVTNDADGNIKSIGSNLSFSYDARGRMQQLDYLGGVILNYSYDAFGRRYEITTNVPPSSGCYVYDGLNPVYTFNGAAFLRRRPLILTDWGWTRCSA